MRKDSNTRLKQYTPHFENIRIDHRRQYAIKIDLFVSAKTRKSH